MFKRFMILILCFGVAILFTTISFSQDDPATADDKKVEDKADDVKDEGLKEATSEDEAEKIGAGPEAKIYFDGTTTFINSQVKFKLTAKDNLFTDKIEYKIDSGEVKEYGDTFSIPDEGPNLASNFGFPFIWFKIIVSASSSRECPVARIVNFCSLAFLLRSHLFNIEQT